MSRLVEWSSLPPPSPFMPAWCPSAASASSRSRLRCVVALYVSVLCVAVCTGSGITCMQHLIIRHADVLATGRGGRRGHWLLAAPSDAAVLCGMVWVVVWVDRVLFVMVMRPCRRHPPIIARSIAPLERTAVASTACARPFDRAPYSIMRYTELGNRGKWCLAARITITSTQKRGRGRTGARSSLTRLRSPTLLLHVRMSNPNVD